MNKRSLIFLCILSATMLVTNLFFKPARSKNETQTAKAATEKVAVAPKKALSSKELPLVTLYRDAEEKTSVAQGLAYSEGILTLSNSSLPSEVYTQTVSSSPVQKMQTASSTTLASNEPVLYTSSNVNKLETPELPQKGTYSVQLVSWVNDSKNPQVTSATLQNGKLYFADQAAPIQNAIALIETSEQSYRPFAMYVAHENTLVSLKSFKQLKPYIELQKVQLLSAAHSQDEKFFVLENEHQQLVFSNLGGALAEINLPFKDEKNKTSQVYAVEFDQKLKDKNSPHALFPAHSFYTHKNSQPQTPKNGGYYPLIRRHLDNQGDASRYYAFNLYSDQANLSQVPYKVTHHDQNKIVFESNQGHRKVVKTYTLDSKSPYSIDLKMEIDGDRSHLWLTSGVPEVELISNMQSPSLKYRHSSGKKAEVSKQKLPKNQSVNSEVLADWISNSNGFFTILMNPQETATQTGFRVNRIQKDLLPSRVLASEDSKKIKNTDGYEFLLPLSDQAKEIHIKTFAGPLEKKLLIQADQLNKSPANYLGAETYMGFLTFISEPCAKFLFIFLNLFFNLTQSWGISIILLTIFLRLILYPLSSWSIKAMRKNQEIAPEVSAIQQKYKKNPKQGQMEIMALYRKKKVNPFTGCLPLIIQMPFLLGMFSLLRSTFVLRGQPFIKGWINNLTAPDVLFTWKQALPVIGNELHLLPIISLIVIWIQQKITSPAVGDKSNMTDQQKQQKLMSYFMLIMVTVFCYNFPSGLSIYFISSTILGILQQWITNKLLDKKKKKPTVLSKKKASATS